MIYGTIKLWKEKEGWGFIEGDDGEDYFINISNVRVGQQLKINNRVKFDIFQGQKGPEAENLSLV
tara:strand:- start:635 stop:829 length:195 start_codon:yes stop_codon:yes gene_type:complete